MLNNNQNSYSGQPNGAWRCPSCETINSGDRCYVCGEQRPQIKQEPVKKKVCSHGHPNSENAKYCSVCGENLDGKTPPPPPPPPPPPWKKLLLVAAAVAVVLFALTRGEEKEAPKPHEHSWSAATCAVPKTCKTCGETSGNTLAHKWKDATCTNPKTCEVCGLTSGSSLGHTWIEATYDAPKTCLVCGKTAGAKLTKPTTPRGYIEKIEASLWEDVTLDHANTYGILFGKTLNDCREMTVNLTVSMKKGAKCKSWQVWGKVDGKYKRIGTLEMPEGTGSASKTFEFDDPINVSGIAVTPKANGGYSWSQDLYVTDIWYSE